MRDHLRGKSSLLHLLAHNYVNALLVDVLCLLVVGPESNCNVLFIEPSWFGGGFADSIVDLVDPSLLLARVADLQDDE